MSVLDDFFGDSKTAKKECSYCGRTDGELIVSISDNYGPTHWKHVECEAKANEENERKVQRQNAEIAMADARDLWEEN